MQTIPYVGYSLYQLFLMFCFWSFIGWCIEVIDMTYETGEYQNRGFLNMPICPIEGLGVIMVTVLFKPISNTIVPLFLPALYFAPHSSFLLAGEWKSFSTHVGGIIPI